MTLATTTLATIRDAYTTRIEAITPTLKASTMFRKGHPDEPIETIAQGATRWFRKFDWDFGDSGELLGMIDPTGVNRQRPLDLIVIYPVAARFYGAGGLEEIDKVVDSDVRQLIDVLESPSYYVSGQNLSRADWTIDRMEHLWVVRISLTVQYYEARTLS